MGLSPVYSPKPAPGAARVPPTKAKALAILHPTHSPAISSGATTPSGIMDLAEQMNIQTREQFVIGSRLGEGTYAVVYSGHYRNNPKSLVAIKKIKLVAEYKDGITMDALREIKFLQELSHPNIIKLHAVYSTKEQNLSLVLEHLPLGDLEQLWKNKDISYGPADIKAWAGMLARAVWFCHENYILHRDIKGNNCLIAADGTVKLADFGLARSFADPGSKPMTHVVITRFYRPPELLYGCKYYGGKVDVWSMGCVIAELALRDFFLPSETDIGQIAKITEVFGTPTEETWPGVSKLDLYVAMSNGGNGDSGSSSPQLKRPMPPSYWRQRFGIMGEDGIEFIKAMLTMDPRKRLSAAEVLKHRYWANAPRPTDKGSLPTNVGGLKTMAEDLKRRGGEVESGRADKVARKLDFGAMKK